MTDIDRSTRSRRRVAGAVALAAVLGSVQSGLRYAAADEISDKQNQSNQLAQAIQGFRQQLTQMQDQETQLRALIAQLDQQITTTQHAIDDAQAQLDQTILDLAVARGRLETLRERLRDDRAKLSTQIVAMYELGPNTAMNSLLQSSDFNQFWQRLIDLRRVSDDQHTVVQRVHDDQVAMQDTVDLITHKEADETALVQKLHDQRAALDDQRAARADAEQRLVAAEQQTARRLAENEQAKKDLDAEIAKLQAEQAAAAMRGGGNGRFTWPEIGPITQGFGCTSYPFEPYDPNCPSRHFHTGIDIGADFGTPVHAADAGIAHTYPSSWGFGNHIIIVHGNGWVSLYGHLTSFSVGDGQPVGRGQVIGLEGSTGNSTGPHLHFEVDLNGNPQDPMRYLP